MSDSPRDVSSWRVAGALSVAIVSISFAAIFFKLAQPTHPLVAAAVRLWIAGVILAPGVIWARGRGHLPGRHIKWGAVAGGLYAVHFGAWVWSLELTSVASSVTLVTATPLLLALLGLLTGRDAPGLRTWSSLVLACVGIGLIGWSGVDGGEGHLVGDALALIGAGAMACYFLVVRPLGESLHVLAFSGVACVFGALALTLACLVSGVAFEVESSRALVALALAALIPQLIGHTCLTWSLRRVSPTIAGIATLGEPVGASLLGVIILGEGVSMIEAVGCAVTLLAVAVVFGGRRDVRVQTE